MLTLLLVKLLLPAVSLGLPSRRDMQLHESRVGPPSGYTVRGPAAPDTVLTLHLALVQNNLTDLVDTLYEVSTPSSSNYGAYLSKEEVSPNGFCITHKLTVASIGQRLPHADE